MKIQAIQNSSVQPQFQGLFKTTTPQQENKKINKKEVVKIGAAVLATALAATTITNIIRGRNYTRQLRNIEEAYRRNMDTMTEPYRRRINDLTENLNAERSANAGLRQANADITELNRQLNQELQDTKSQLDDILNSDTGISGIRDKVYDNLKAVTDKAELGYDAMEPPVTGLGQKKVYTDAIDLPARVKTTNRANMRVLDIPEIEPSGRFHFEMPKSEEMKVTQIDKTRNFTPRSDQMTNVSESYADSVQWNNDKIARDVLQNFFDGHGQTLDGVRFNFEPVGNGRYRVRIEGDSSYSADKAIFIGESTKRDNAKAAGNYGEGLKMASLKLIRDKGAKDVKIGSDNWDLTFKLMENDLTDKQVMGYDLEKTAKKAGNYIEFETDDRDLLETLRKTINRFYHSGNEHFKTPDFENNIFGLKVLKQPKKGFGGIDIPGEKGAIYIAGQRFEYDGDYDGLQGAIIFLKEKPPKNVLDPSRDRTTLNQTDLRNISEWLCKRYDLSKEDRIKLINTLEPVWDNTETPLGNFFDAFAWYQGSIRGGVHINFPDNYVAYSPASPELVQDLERKGYKVCNKNMEDLGMQTIKNLMGDARKHDPIKPTEAQMKKIAVLKEAIKKLAPSLKAEGFAPAEIDTKIFIFNNTKPKESRLYASALAEAITDGGASKGFWIDKNYLDSANFSEVLETALHEISHKVGGDETAEFSYKLTNVNKRVIHQILEEPQTRSELQALGKLWEKYTQTPAAV